MLGQALWSAAHGGDTELYIEIFESLIAAGAKLPPRHVPVNPQNRYVVGKTRKLRRANVVLV